MGVSKTKDSVTGPLHLALDITNKCNYRCLHCYNASGENCVVDKNPICIEWGDPLDHIFRYREGNDSCYTTMSIKANGDIAPSPYLPLSIGNIRCHTLQEYWDSGYPKIWKLPILKKMASTLNTVDDMQCDSMGYNTWIDRDYSCDIIDEHLME